MRVFISYSSKDGKDYAEKLCAILKKRGHAPFFADHDIYSAEILWDVIAKECLDRDLSIFVITLSSKESKGQKQEYELITYHYRNRMVFVNENAHNVVKSYPFLEPRKGLEFNDSNFDEMCEELSSQLVRLQDKEKMVAKHEKEFEDKRLPVLSQDGLDASEMGKCIKNLGESFQKETIIPELFRTQTHEKWMPNLKFVGFDYRLPREWFLSNQLYSNDLIFSQFGRIIALWEQNYIQDQILSKREILYIESDFSPEAILKAIKEMSDRGFEPDVIFAPIKYFTKMYHWRETAHVEYSRKTPRPRVDASLIIGGFSLRIVPSIGKLPLKDIVFLNAKVIRWHVKRHPKYGALCIAFGNDRLYPMKYVELIAGTIVSCEIEPKGISILRIKEE